MGTTQEAKQKKTSFFMKMLAGIEKAGNKLPDPVILFAIICTALLIISALVAGTEVVHPGTGATITAVSLLTKENLQWILMSFPSNFLAFAPLGAVLTIVLGCGYAEKSGWLVGLVRLAGSKASARTVTIIVVFVGIMANQCGDAGWIVLPPLAAMLYMAVGRNPLVGIFAAYAAVSTGMAANLLISMSDVLAGSFTIAAAQTLDPSFEGNMAMNWWFLIVSTGILLLSGVIATDKIVEPRLRGRHSDIQIETTEELTALERKGLKAANWTFIGLLVLLVVLSIGPGAFMKDPATDSLMSNSSPLLGGIVSIVTIAFFIPATVYGKIAGTIKSGNDAVRMLGDAMRDMGGYIVLAFVAAQFSAWFTKSQLATVIAVKGAEILKSMGLGSVGLIVGLIIVSCIVNLFIGSASAKWAILAPVFVPMFMVLGMHPAVTQMAYRIGDSITNVLSPLFPYATVLLAYVRKYDKDAGWGTLFSNMLPYSILMGISWTVLLIIYVVFNIPLGPGGPIYYTM